MVMGISELRFEMSDFKELVGEAVCPAVARRRPGQADVKQRTLLTGWFEDGTGR
jgi:hypothetical protein